MYSITEVTRNSLVRKTTIWSEVNSKTLDSAKSAAIKKAIFGTTDVIVGIKLSDSSIKPIFRRVKLKWIPY